MHAVDGLQRQEAEMAYAGKGRIPATVPE